MPQQVQGSMHPHPPIMLGDASRISPELGRLYTSPLEDGTGLTLNMMLAFGARIWEPVVESSIAIPAPPDHATPGSVPPSPLRLQAQGWGG